MKHISESIIGKRGNDWKSGLWTLDLLVPRRSGNWRVLTGVLTNIAYAGTGNSQKNPNDYFDTLSGYLKMKDHIMGVLGEKRAIEEARKYLKNLRTNEFIGITRPYGEDEPEPLDWDYIIGIDSNDKEFILAR